MMKNKLNNELIATIKKFIPDEANITNIITDILGIGKESVYRRLRGDINFSFEEISLIALELGFSVDNILGIKKQESAVFELNFLKHSTLEDLYSTRIEQYAEMLKETIEKESKITMAMNTLSYIFYYNLDTICRFQFYKWVCQTQNIYPIPPLKDFKIPEKLSNSQKLYASIIDKKPQLTIVFDDNLYSSIINNINYFYKRELISDSEIEQIKEELLITVDILEKATANGITDTGSDIEIYLSSVYLDTSYLYVEYNNIKFCQYLIYSINTLNSINPQVCEIQKEWIESLKKYSVLITKSGEVQRYEFFKKQKELISSSFLMS